MNAFAIREPSAFDILFPAPTGGRNADDMGLPPPACPTCGLRLEGSIGYACSNPQCTVFARVTS